MRNFYITVITILFTSFQASAQTWEWTKPEPNGVDWQNPLPLLGEETDVAHDIETDASGNVYVLGDFTDSLYLNNIFREIGRGSYLAKYDSTGALIWYKTIVPADFSISNYNKIQATDLTVNAQGIYITGKYFGSYYTAYDCSSGVNTGVDRSYKIGNFNFTSARNDVGLFITKFNSTGNVVWNKTATEPPCVNGGQWGIDMLLIV